MLFSDNNTIRGRIVIPTARFELRSYDPYESPLRADVAAFLAELTQVRPSVEAPEDAKNVLPELLRPYDVYRLPLLAFSMLFFTTCRTRPVLLGNYVWTQEERAMDRCILFTTRDGLFVQGIPDELRPTITTLSSLIAPDPTLVI